MKPQRLGWIDFLKGLAISAVFVDHTVDILYTHRTIQWASFFSVGLFVIVAGGNAYSSLERRTCTGFDHKFIISGLKKIILPYIAATCFARVARDSLFKLPDVLNSLWRFNAEGAYYFVVFYIQLIVIAPFLYLCIKIADRSKRRQLFLTVQLTLVCCTAYLSFRFSRILPVHGGGGLYLAPLS
jgi:fucose 4-O-acetylase-like acetyltransferase